MIEEKYHIIDFSYDNGSTYRTRVYSTVDQNDEAQAFCAKVREKGGKVNIRIRYIDFPH